MAEAAAEPTMDCNLPELLAQDLEFSSLIFTSKNMTAGAPSPALASDENDWQPSAEAPTILGVPCHPNGVPQFQPLGAIDEKSSASGASDHDLSDDASSSSGLSFSEAEGEGEGGECGDDDVNDDVDDDEDEDDEDDAAAASPQIRHQSVRTVNTAVSVPSKIPIAESHKRLVSFCDESEAEGSSQSWMDLEPEAPGDHPELGKSMDQSPVLTPVRPVRPLSRLGDKSITDSPPRAKTANAASATRRLSNPFDGYTRPASRARSLQVDPTTAADKEENRLSLPSLHSVEIAVPTRYSSLRHHVSFTDDARKAIASRSSRSSRPRSHTASSRPASEHVTPSAANRSSVIAALKEELEPWFRYVDEPEEDHPRLGPPLLVTPCPPSRSGKSAKSLPASRPRSQSQARSKSRPTSPASATYTWLEDPIDIPIYSSDEAHRIPLPPNVIESLRISVTCFPETILLCSSLSIETIRSYSRKVRHPVEEPVRPVTPPASPKRWRWLAPRRNANSVRRCSRGASSSNLDLTLMPPSTATLAPPQWSRIRNLFPSGSDYLCDALYAHIVAYNYLAPMAQNAVRPPTPETPETYSSTDEAIPKKAASLLGLQSLQDTTTSPPPPPPRSLRKRPSMFLGRRAGSSRQTTASGVPGTPLSTPDAPLRDLMIGLKRCIARLVTTLRTEGLDGPVAGDSVNDIDPLIMRSLCEIVKCCEESTTNDKSLS